MCRDGVLTIDELKFIENLFNDKLLNLHTAFLGKVLSVQAGMARVQPLNMYMATNGEALEPTVVSSVVPPYVKLKTETITYRTSGDMIESKTVLVPQDLEKGDIVFCGVCERDISNAKNGIISQPAKRHHNMNDSVILCVLR